MAAKQKLGKLDFDPYISPSTASGVVDFNVVKLDAGKQISRSVFGKPAFKIDKPARVHAIANLFGGGGGYRAPVKLSALEAFKSFLAKEGVETVVYETLRVGHAIELAESLPADAEVIVVWGGDGTVQEVTQGLMHRTDDLRLRAPLALVGAGSGNALALGFGLYKQKSPLKENALATAREILNGSCQNFDLFKISYPAHPERPVAYCNLIFSWGNTTALFRHVEVMRKRYGLGNSRYVLGVLYRLFWRNYPPRPRLRIIVDDEYELEIPQSWLERNIFANEITVCNMSEMFSYQMSPMAQADDGKLEAQIVPRMLTKRYLRAATAHASAHKNFVGPKQEFTRPIYIRFNKLRLEWHPDAKEIKPDDTWIAADGTLIEGQDGIPVEIECVPAALRVLCAAAVP